MFLTRWLRASNTDNPACRDHHRCFRPGIERLEDRTVPATFVVDTPLDRLNPSDGVLSLREAIAAANDQAGDDVITFSVSGTINLTGPLPLLLTNIDVKGPGAANLTVRRDTGGDYGVFYVGGAFNIVTISGLSIENGRAFQGGGIYNANSGGTLNVIGCSLSNNTAFLDGAGIANSGTLRVTDCTFFSNKASRYGGAIANQGSATVTTSTLANNEAQYGGGISNISPGLFSGASLTVNSSTLSDNAATAGGGGIYNGWLCGTKVYNSIVANSRVGVDVLNDWSVLGSFNIVESGAGLDSMTNTIFADPRLGPLQDNGGPTWTCALRPSSPAIDAGDNGLIAKDNLDIDGDGNMLEPESFDQRGAGYPRVMGTVDLGAVEDSVLAFKAPISGGPNRLVLRRAGDNVQLMRNGIAVSTRPLDHTFSVDLRGVDFWADVLTIDFAAGAFPIPGGIKFAGGSGAQPDTIAARGDADMILTNNNLTLLGGDVNLAVAFAGIEAAQLSGGVGDNLLDASGFSGRTTLNGGSGDDQLIGGAGIDCVYGSSGDDRLTGLAGNDLLDGGSGIDTLVEAGDVDFTLATARLTGLGSDTLRWLEAAELTGGEGGNIINASRFAGPVILDGGAGNDVLVGGILDDFLIGSSGRDILIGGRGADGLDGGEGDDILIGGTTGYEASRVALEALRSEWASTTTDYATRVGHLRGTITAGVNGTYRLTFQKVKHDLAENTFAGSSDLDWFFAKSLVDEVTDKDLGGAEIVTALV